MKKLLIVFLIAAFLPLGFVSSPQAGTEVDILLKKLVEKGVLTQEEAKTISKETTEDVKKQIKKHKADWLPKWVMKTKIKGDMRLRYQYQKEDGSIARNRGRFRYRISITNQVTDNVKVGLRLASGSSDPRSTNQTLGDTFSSKPIQIDRAYVEMKFFDALKIYGGKFKNPIFEPGDMLWDTDINPEGATFYVDYAPFYASASFWILDEYSSSSLDPYMVPIQIGIAPKFDPFWIKAAVTGYFFGNVKDNTLDYSEGENTLNDDGTLKYNYNSVAGSLEVGMTTNVFNGFIKQASLFGTVINNFDPDSNNIGWQAGFKINKTPKEFGKWFFSVNYRYLGRDAWLDTFPDSDAFDGMTGVKGFEGIFRFGLFKNTHLSLDYYHLREIDGFGGDRKYQRLFQADLIFEF